MNPHHYFVECLAEKDVDSGVIENLVKDSHFLVLEIIFFLSVGFLLALVLEQISKNL